MSGSDGTSGRAGGRDVPTVALVLAAGRGSRFGGTKQVAELDGVPLVVHATATARAAGVDDVIVVVGFDAARVRGALPDAPGLTIVENPRPEDGMSSSLRVGVHALPRATERLLVLLADQPGVEPATVVAVLDGLDGYVAARAAYRDRPGHPVAFSASVFDRLTELGGDAGARHLLDELRVNDVPIDADLPRDVDTPADLVALSRERGIP